MDFAQQTLLQLVSQTQAENASWKMPWQKCRGGVLRHGLVLRSPITRNNQSNSDSPVDSDNEQGRERHEHSMPSLTYNSDHKSIESFKIYLRHNSRLYSY